MQALRSFRSVKAPLVMAATGLYASSTRLERRTAAEPAAALPHVRATDRNSPGEIQDPSAAGNGVEEAPAPMAIGPMIAVFLDQPSVDRLKSHFPEAREGQLRKVVLQYGPSATERKIYQHLFSGRAKVTVTGEAASFGRRALVVGVSHAGGEVEPMSLSSAIDISPPPPTEEISLSPEDGPGPLGSAVLVEQVKRAGATTQDAWHGILPPLRAFNRQFPSEEGAYMRLEQPITVNGTICRADWVDGVSTRCRDTTEGGKKREEDWKPSHCSICAVFEASPCSEIFSKRFIPASRKFDEHTKALQAQDQEGQGETTEDGDREAERVRKDSHDRPRGESSRGGGGAHGDSGKVDVVNTGEARVAMTTSGEDEDEVENGAEREVNSASHGESAEEERDLIGEKLQADVLAAIQDLRECMIYHDM
ncbi:unnamed protein product [Ascophyllum nodosum]